MPTHRLIQGALTDKIIGAFFEVYNSLGFGHFEHIYVLALAQELSGQGLRVGREVQVPVSYKGHALGVQRLDMVVEEKVVVEVKSTYELHRAAKRQLYSYLHATDLEVGLLLHFGPDAKFHRMISSNPDVHPLDPHNPQNLRRPWSVHGPGATNDRNARGIDDVAEHDA